MKEVTLPKFSTNRNHDHLSSSFLHETPPAAPVRRRSDRLADRVAGAQSARPASRRAYAKSDRRSPWHLRVSRPEMSSLMMQKINTAICFLFGAAMIAMLGVQYAEQPHDGELLKQNCTQQSATYRKC